MNMPNSPAYFPFPFFLLDSVLLMPQTPWNPEVAVQGAGGMTTNRQWYSIYHKFTVELTVSDDNENLTSHKNTTELHVKLNKVFDEDELKFMKEKESGKSRIYHFISHGYCREDGDVNFARKKFTFDAKKSGRVRGNASHAMRRSAMGCACRGTDRHTRGRDRR